MQVGQNHFSLQWPSVDPLKIVSWGNSVNSIFFANIHVTGVQNVQQR
jgi:hypothetical protein